MCTEPARAFAQAVDQVPVAGRHASLGIDGGFIADPQLDRIHPQRDRDQPPVPLAPAQHGPDAADHLPRARRRKVRVPDFGASALLPKPLIAQPQLALARHRPGSWPVTLTGATRHPACDAAAVPTGRSSRKESLMPEQADVKATIVLVHGAFADGSTRRTLARCPREGFTMPTRHRPWHAPDRRATSSPSMTASELFIDPHF